MEVLEAKKYKEEPSTGLKSVNKIDLEPWTNRQYNDALKVCNVFGIEFIELFREPWRAAPKPDIRTVITQMLSERHGLKDRPISDHLKINRSTVLYHKKRFERLFKVDKEFRSKCLMLNVEP